MEKETGIKIKVLKRIIIPTVETLFQYIQSRHILERSVNDLLVNTHKLKEGLTNTVSITYVDQQWMNVQQRERSAKTLSFNMLFAGCEELACYELANARAQGILMSELRPRIDIINGEVSGYHIFVHQGKVVMAIIVYATNLKSWAECVNLGKTAKFRTDIPTSHFLYKREAMNNGYLWLTPELQDPTSW